MNKIPVFILDYVEWDDLINKVLTPTYEYDVVADEEWNNDTDHYFSNVVPDDSLYFIRYGEPKVQEVLTNGRKAHYATWELLTELVNRDLLPAGNYLIRVNW